MNALGSITGLSVEEADLFDAPASARIDAFVAGYEGAALFHRPAWSRAVERGCRQRARYLVARSPAGGIEGVLPLTEMRSLLFGNALVSAGFGTGGGILARTAEAERALVSAAERLADRLSITTIELRGGVIPEGWATMSDRHAAFSRQLPSEADKLLDSIPRKQRAEVRKAIASGLVTTVSEDRRGIGPFYSVYAESVRNLGTPVFPRALFTAMHDEFAGECDILTVAGPTGPLSSVFTFYFRETALPFWGGGRFDARGARANEALYYALMSHAIRRGCTTFDFGRSKCGSGAYSYKKNWGFEPQPLSYAVKTAEGAETRDINPLDPRHSARIALWRRLPVWATRIVGPPLARGLG